VKVRKREDRVPVELLPQVVYRYVDRTRGGSGTWAGEAANDATNDETCDAEGAHRQMLGGVRVDTLTLRLGRKTASRGGVTRLTGLTPPKCCRRRMTACDAGEGEQRQDVREREEKLIGQCPSERLKHEL